MKHLDITELETLYESIILENSLTYASKLATHLAKKESPIEVIKNMCLVLQELKRDSYDESIFKQMEKTLIDFVNLSTGYNLITTIEWGKKPSFFEDVVYTIKNNTNNK